MCKLYYVKLMLQLFVNRHAHWACLFSTIDSINIEIILSSRHENILSTSILF